jgi:hypothetical protein
MGEVRNVYKILVGKSEELDRPLGDVGFDGRLIFKRNLEK